MEEIKEQIESLFETEPGNYHGTPWSVRSALIIIAEKLDSIEKLLHTEN